MIVSLLYEVTQNLLSVPSVPLRSDVTKDAELLVLRHENIVLRRQQAGPVHYEPARWDIGGSKSSRPARQQVAASTVWETLHAADIDPAPRPSGPA